jgi:hypothetical protein
MSRRTQHDSLPRLRQLLVCQHPSAYCDACLAFHLDVSLAEANASALTVGSEPGFTRDRRECYGCRRTIQLTSMTNGQ